MSSPSRKSPAASRRLAHASLLRMGRVLWLITAAFFWLFWLAGVPRFLHRAAAGDLPTVAALGRQVPSLVAAERAADWGVSIPTWAWINVFCTALTVLLPTLLALLIWQRRRDGFGLFTAFVLLFTGSEAMGVVIYAARLSTTALIIWEAGIFIWPAFLLWLYLFPDGQPVPRRLVWIMYPLVALAYIFFGIAVIAGWVGALGWEPLAAQLQPIAFAVVMLTFGLTILAQIYRYIRVSGPVQRRQTLWFVLGVGLFFCLSAVLDFFGNVPAEISSAAFLLVPLGVAVSILRYRLWDIDVIIHKTLVYSAVTLLLGLVYAGSVILLQTVLGRLTQGQSPLVIVVSTLLVAALFAPVRRRVQTQVDRRFYRQKYDAAGTLTRFSRSLRDEVDLDAMMRDIQTVVQESLQPEMLTIWLQDPTSSGSRQPQDDAPARGRPHHQAGV